MDILAVRSEEDLKRLSVGVSKSVGVCALGFFDGVHIAHRSLIEKAKAEAKTLGIPLSVFTFFSGGSSLKSEKERLLTDEEKLSELELLGVDTAVVFDFEIIKDLSATAFVEEILVRKLNTHTAFCGFNFRFGRNAEGDAAALENLMSANGRRTVTVPEYKKNNRCVSSSEIRGLLKENKLADAARLLGKPFFIDGSVSHGLGLGKALGFPTVNVGMNGGKFKLQNGVYYTAVELSGKIYSGITNVGICPTFDEREKHTETFILNFDGNIYDSKIRIYFIEFLREEIKFSSKEALISQINVDKNRALSLKKEIPWQEIGLSLQ
ncbi:MAG: bifunctional riboflavin kinase/FAD synthetase [Ruminococcaceae bacterium]|nr:bifunctional riboflavin kinase/FAD synthetase [Oscillospiraceae bacterium]